MGHKEILSLLLCFLFFMANNFASSQESNRRDSACWFHIDANIFKIKYVLPLNMSSNSNVTMDIVVPKDNPFQKLIEVSSEPRPNSTFIDGKGLMRLRHKITTDIPRFLNITIHYTVMIFFSSLVNCVSQAEAEEDIPMEIQERFTKPAPYIESDDDCIAGNATAISANATNMYSKINELFNFVSNRTLFEYDEGVQNISRKSSSHVRGALWALKNHKGVCFDFAHLFVALLRAEGIPSRVSEGIILDGRSGFMVHDWAEVYFPKVGWVPFDPTWEEAESNIHMKILNPLYDGHMRWNYSIQSGQLYRFPKNSKYEVNDQIYIENMTYPNVIDSLIIINDSHIALARTFEFDNETISSRLNISQGSWIANILYGGIQVRFGKSILSIKAIDYQSHFSYYPPENMQIQVSAPWNLIFSGTIIPGLSSLTYSYTSGTLHLHFIHLLTAILISIGLIMFLLLIMCAKKY